MDRENQAEMNVVAQQECDAMRREMAAMRVYRIIRFRQNGRKRVIRNNVTLTEAQAHCSREDTHGVRGGQRWFDGYDYMPGCRPDTRGD